MSEQLRDRSVIARWAAVAAALVLGAGLAQVVPQALATTSSGERAIFEPLTPARLMDTRLTGNPFTRQEQRSLTIVGTGGVPADATAVLLNVTIVGSTGPGFLSLFPADTDWPGSSNLNFYPNEDTPNAVTVKLSAGGAVKIYNGSEGTTQVVVDVMGYYRGHDHDDRYAKTLGVQVVNVRGDGTAAANGTALRSAMTAITDASASKPYTVQLGAGSYDLGATQFTVKAFVTISGAGRGATFLTSTAGVANPNGALTMGNNSEVSRLSFTNTPPAVNATRIAVGVPSGVSARLVDVFVKLVTTRGVVVLPQGGTVDIVDSHLRGEFPSGSVFASVAYSYLSATMRIRDSRLELVADSSSNESVVGSQDAGVLEVENSRLISNDQVARIVSTPATLRIANSLLDGVTTGVGATIVCFDTYDENFAAVSCSA